MHGSQILLYTPVELRCHQNGESNSSVGVHVIKSEIFMFIVVSQPSHRRHVDEVQAADSARRLWKHISPLDW
jgi:hypothetical protein